MQFKKPADNEKYQWTNHVVDKMQYYGISESLIKRIVGHPQRTEEGIAPKTVAVMQPKKVKEHRDGKPTKWEEEIWVMWQEIKTKDKSKVPGFIKRRIISAWRYPGMSPKRAAIPIPDEILSEIENML